MGGGGGFVGTIINQFRYCVDAGFATFGTDTGHEGPVHLTGWVEKEEAPERVVVSKITDKQIVLTRPVYPYPKKAGYDGTGNPNLESSFVLIKDQK